MSDLGDGSAGHQHLLPLTGTLSWGLGLCRCQTLSWAGHLGASVPGLFLHPPPPGTRTPPPAPPRTFFSSWTT